MAGIDESTKQDIRGLVYDFFSDECEVERESILIRIEGAPAGETR